jgi:ERCC4-related helicase
MIEEGTWVWSKTKQARGKVIEVAELWGTTQLRLWLPKEDLVLLHRLEEVDEEIPLSGLSDETYSTAHLRYAAVLGKLATLIHDDKLLAPLDSAVTPLPHQIKALKKVLSRPRVRFLLADEVGLGKTIEAGLVIKELKMRGRIKRILVIAPKGLIPQWIVEMQERFGETFRFFEPAAFEGYRQMTGAENAWKSYDRVICSMDAVKPLESRRGWSAEQVQAYNQERILDLSAADWDLVIIDESHRVAGSADTVARHAMARMVAEATPHLLLLSATPHQGKTESFQRLMRLLDRDAFADPSSVDRKRVAPFVVRTEKRNATDHQGKPLFTPRITKMLPVPWGEHTDQEELYEAVTEYVREGYNKALSDKNSSYGFLMILMQRLVTSSTEAIAATLGRRIEALRAPEEQLQLFSDHELQELQEQDGEAQLEAVLKKQIKALKNERAEVEALHEAAKRVIARGPDAKAEALLDTIYKLQQDEADPELKVLIFTEFVPTQRMLAEFLEGSGFSVVCLNGSMNLDERKATQKAFSEDARIMISTDAGGEGLNLQFCHIIINFDLGWRPMALEQRIGRVDRIGQKHVVKALNLVLEDSVEYRVREVLEAKLAVIFEEFGIDKTSDVLDSEAGAHIFDKLFVDALLEPNKIDQDVDEVAGVVRQEATWNSEQLNVLGEDEPDASIERDVSTQPIHDYLDIFVQSYTSSAGGSYERSGESSIRIQWPDEAQEESYHLAGADSFGASNLLTLDHPRIRKLLEEPPQFHVNAMIPTFQLPSLPGSKAGYWSLWALRFTTNETRLSEFFPVFTNLEGRSFDRSAHVIWDNLLNQELHERDAQPNAEILNTHRRIAEKNGEPIFRRMEEKHQDQQEEHKRNREHYFEVRFKQLNQIGLPEVRQFRLRQLELEQESWRQEFNASRSSMPELVPVILTHLIPE